MFSLRKKKLDLPTTDEALPGRAQPLPVPARHFVNGNRLEAPFPAGMQLALFGLKGGCFWGIGRTGVSCDIALDVTARRAVVQRAALKHACASSRERRRASP